MREIGVRVWHEPAVAIGLATSIAIVVITVAKGDPWDTATIAGVAAPLISALGIRQLVTPVAAGADGIAAEPMPEPPADEHPPADAAA